MNEEKTDRRRRPAVADLNGDGERARSAVNYTQDSADVKSNPLLDAALSYAARGWRVLPCEPLGKMPAGALVPHGVKDATTDATVIRRWWTAMPDANIGIAAGPLVFVDVDAKGDRDGRPAWRALVSELGNEIEHTVNAETPHGGAHYYYTSAVAVKNAPDAYAAGVELRGAGMYVVAPPSRTPDGEYSFTRGHAPDEVAVAAIPPALVARLSRKAESVKVAKTADNWLLDALRGVATGERNNTATRLAGLLRRRGFDSDAILELLRCWNLRNDAPLPDDELATVARSVGRYAADAVRDVHFTTARELLSREFAPIQWLVADLLPAGTFAVLIARAKTGKSWFCLQLADTMARGGGELLGKSVNGGRTLMFALEDAERYLQERLKLQSCTASDDIILADAIPALDADGIIFLQEAIAQYEPDLLIIDTFSSAKSGKLDENDAGQVADVMNALRNLAHDTGVAVLLTHHSTKMALGDVILDARGSSAVGAAVDVALGIYLDNDSTRGVLKATGRVIRRDEFNVQLDAATMRWRLTSESLSAAEEEVLDCLAAYGQADANAIAKELGIARQSVHETLQRLVGKCKVVRAPTRSAAGSTKIIYMPVGYIPAEPAQPAQPAQPAEPAQVEPRVLSTAGSAGSAGRYIPPQPAVVDDDARPRQLSDGSWLI